MNNPVLVGPGAVALVLSLLLGCSSSGSPRGSEPSVQSTPTPETSVSEPSAEPTTAAGGLPEGPFVVQDEGAHADAPRITVTIPAPGWTPRTEFGGLEKGTQGHPPQSAMLLWAWPAGTTFDVYGDPCNWASTEPINANTVDELAAALAAQPSRDGSDPVDVTVGGHVGKHVTLHVPDDANFRECDQGTFASYGANGGEPNRIHHGPGQIDEFWILDVDGAFVILDAMYRADTSPELLEEMRGIAESAMFEAP